MRVFLQSLFLQPSAAGGGFVRYGVRTAPPIGAQLYTLRKEVVKDLPGTLAGVRKIGITQVEAFPTVYTHPAAELKRIIEDAGLIHSPARTVARRQGVRRGGGLCEGARTVVYGLSDAAYFHVERRGLCAGG